jgi:mannose-1-phosphate guanylyltransferase
MDNKKQESNIVVLIMAGGSGERFWPLSTRERPKQLLKLIDPDKSLIRLTVERVTPMVPLSNIFIATNSIQAPAVTEELPELPQDNIIIEPAFKDTAAAIGFASVVIGRKIPESTMIVLASDHLIRENDRFREILSTAARYAGQEDAIITLGIKPTSPETGYGYLETGDSGIASGSEQPLPLKVSRFCEKPPLETAIEYLKDGKHLWNSGMFIFKISVMMEAFKRLLPEHYSALKEIEKLGERMRDPDDTRLQEIFGTFRKISIDFGIMEKFEKTLVIPSDFGWNDIGSFPALAEVFPGNENNSVVTGTESKELNSGNNIIFSTTGKKISLIGISETVIVETEDNILICKKEEAQNIKKLLNQQSDKTPEPSIG